MYEAFYGLREKPFTLLPDPDYLYLSPKHQRALTLLEYGMMNHAGFSVICGDTGAGKTTLVKILSGIIHPDSGTVDIMGYNPWHRKNSFRSRISLIMGQKAQLWWDLPAADCFLLLKEIYRIPEAQYRQRPESR